GGVDGEGLVRGHRPVDERPLRAAAVPLTQLLERPFALPDRQDLELERRMVGLVRKRDEHRIDRTEREECVLRARSLEYSHGKEPFSMATNATTETFEQEVT